jgi:1,4-alpha-glucan branching enzyme
VPRHGYRVGVPHAGLYKEIFNSDSAMFGGSNMGNNGALAAEEVPSHGRPASLRVTFPPLGVVVFKP